MSQTTRSLDKHVFVYAIALWDVVPGLCRNSTAVLVLMDGLHR
jgi:hypothetical protein